MVAAPPASAVVSCLELNAAVVVVERAVDDGLAVVVVASLKK